MEQTRRKPRRNYKRITIIVTVVFIIAVMALVLSLNVKSALDQEEILSRSVQAQLLSICYAARETIDVDIFDQLNSPGDRNEMIGAYGRTLTRLRLLANDVGADYIYALKEYNGEYIFIYDTDLEVDTSFTPYEIYDVHKAAFAGDEVGGVMNVQDEFGSFNTAAIPIWKDGKAIGVVSTDIRDTLMTESHATIVRNAIILGVTMTIAMALLLVMVIVLLGRVEKMEESLRRLAHYDTVTGLPNRQYLLEYLGQITADGSQAPFALLFIDLDNFKTVNDNAGHEAGDDLLRDIAEYLNAANANQNIKAFRPAAGKLNLSARIGGDEFVQVAMGVSTIEEAEAIAQGLLGGFTSTKLDRYVEKYSVGLSIGVALFPYHTANFHVLIKYADLAMYSAKHAGKNQYRIYADEMSKTDAPENP